MNRRKLVQAALAAGAITGTAGLTGAELPRTPRDFAGPFYPRGARNRTSDLIVGEPRADVLQLRGRVTTPAGAPYAGALVDIWQADPNGRYKHPRDDGQDQLLDEFLYWGEAATDEDGAFAFRTYVPGRYSARPAQHIHYKVWLDRQEVLTSQMYFHELGGAKGLARSGQAALQTIHLVRAGEHNHRAEIAIVL